jgi:hypothetical protein
MEPRRNVAGIALLGPIELLNSFIVPTLVPESDAKVRYDVREFGERRSAF